LGKIESKHGLNLLLSALSGGGYQDGQWLEAARLIDRVNLDERIAVYLRNCGGRRPHGVCESSCFQGSDAQGIPLWVLASLLAVNAAPWRQPQVPAPLRFILQYLVDFGHRKGNMLKFRCFDFAHEIYGSNDTDDAHEVTIKDVFPWIVAEHMDRSHTQLVPPDEPGENSEICGYSLFENTSKARIISKFYYWQIDEDLVYRVY